MALKSPSDFYAETLVRSNLEPYVPEAIEKVAERMNVTVEVAKLAARYFEQLQLDKIAYPTEQDRVAESVALATKYVEYRDGKIKQAAALADDALLTFLRAGAAFVAEKKVAGLSAAAVLRMAVLQLDSMDEATKAAAWTGERAPATQALLATTEPAKVASVVPELAAWAGRDPLAVTGAGAEAFLQEV